MVFHQGDAADLVYIVEEGAVEIFRVRPDGTEDQLATITPGHYFGEIGPLLGLPRSASARNASAQPPDRPGPREFRTWSGTRRTPEPIGV